MHLLFIRLSTRHELIQQKIFFTLTLDPNPVESSTDGYQRQKGDPPGGGEGGTPACVEIYPTVPRAWRSAIWLKEVKALAD